jgi:hypothetical protein
VDIPAGSVEISKIEFRKPRKQILQIDAVQLEKSPQFFKRGSVHLSLDTGTIDVNSIVDVVLLRIENLSE